MFTWICPQCGREVPPAYNDCPDCAEKAKGGVAPATPQPSAPVPQASPMSPSQMAPSPAVQQPQVPYQQVRVKKGGGLGLLVVLLVAIVLVGAGAVGYYYLPSVRAQREAAAPAADAPAAAVEAPKAGGEAKAAPGSRASKFVEITGLRILEENKKPQIRFLVVNHSAAELAGLKGVITLKATSSADALATVPFDVTGLDPWEAKDITAPLKTKLRVYELPDWQFLKAEVQMTAP